MPPRDGRYGWAFGLHEALDQFGAMCGPLLVARVLAASHGSYHSAFAVLAVPAAIKLSLLASPALYPRPQDLEPATPRSPPARTAPAFLGLPRRRRPGRRRLRRLSDHRLPLSAKRDRPRRPDPDLLRRRHGGERPRLAGVRAAVRPPGIAVLIPADDALRRLRTARLPRRVLGRPRRGRLWGVGMGVHESIIPAAVAPMVPPERRASAFGLFTGGYGIAWFRRQRSDRRSVRGLARRRGRLRRRGRVRGDPADSDRRQANDEPPARGTRRADAAAELECNRPQR